MLQLQVQTAIDALKYVYALDELADKLFFQEKVEIEDRIQI